MNRKMICYGFVLILLALLSGMFVPAMAIPRLGLSAHTIGVLSGVLLIAIGAVWSQFRLSLGQATLMAGAWLYSSYANWLGCLAGAVFGAGRTTPVAAAGVTGSGAAEALVAFLLFSVAATSLLAVTLSIWGMRTVHHRPAAHAEPD